MNCITILDHNGDSLGMIIPEDTNLKFENFIKHMELSWDEYIDDDENDPNSIEEFIEWHNQSKPVRIERLFTYHIGY